MNETRGSQPSLFETLGIPPGVGLVVLFAGWCVLVWYWWTRARPAVEEQLGERLASRWRAVVPFGFAAWVFGTGLYFVVELVRLLK